MGRIIEIKDASAVELDAYARLTEAQLRNRLDPDNEGDDKWIENAEKLLEKLPKDIGL